MEDTFIWADKYRPKTVEECILPKRLKNIFLQYVKSGEIPNLLLTGSAGVGKTTVALAMCEEIGLNHLFINGSSERGIDVLRTQIRTYASTISLTGGKKVIILDEADYLTNEAQAALRGTIEEFTNNCTFIFTCNYKARLIDAIHSRTALIEFKLEAKEKEEMAISFFKRVISILDKEHVTYNKGVVAKIVEKHFPDYRRTLGELQKFATLGPIDVSTLMQLSDVRSIQDLVKALKEKNFTAMRKWVVSNSDIEPARVFRVIYDGLYEYFKPETIPIVVVTLAKYQYQSAFVADQELNMVACLTEIMVDAEIK